MAEILLAPALVLAVLGCWVGVEHLYARFQARYPQLGPYRDLAGGCHCCQHFSGGGCARAESSTQLPTRQSWDLSKTL